MNTRLRIATRLPLGLGSGPQVPSVALLAGLRPTWRTRLRHLPSVARAAALTILAAGVSGLAGPWVDVPRQGLDVLLLIDVSQSMRAQDSVPDRLGAATALAREVVAARPDDRFGVLLFAGDNALACPLTSDHTAVLDRLSAVDVSAGSGTAIGNATLAALKRLPAGRDGTVLLLFTDGASNAGARSPVEAAALLRRERVRVFTVGVGRTGMAPFPTEAGLVDMPSEVDEHMLRAIAQAADGAFVRVGDPGAAAAITEALTRVPAAPITPRSSDTPVALRVGVAAVLLVAIELIVAVLVLQIRS